MPRRPPVQTNLPAEPVAGAVPPAHAPREVSQPLTAGAGGVVYADGTVMDPAARARQNARQLEPLLANGPKDGSVAPPVAQSAVTGKQINGLDPFYARQQEGAQQALAVNAAVDALAFQQPPTPTTVRRVRRPHVMPPAILPVQPGAPPQSMQAAIAGTTAAEVTPVIERTASAAGDYGLPTIDPPALPAIDPDAPPPLTEEELARMPAASNSDSPSRGQLRAPLPPGKEITGGFGLPASLTYYALNGGELKTVIEQLMDQLHARLQNDLRFNEAIVYPRVAVKVLVEVEGFAHGYDFLVPQVLLPTHPATSKNPIEFCRTVADEVAFVLVEEMREVDDEGKSVTPPDQVREELGLQRPTKQQVKLGAGHQFVDIP